MNRDEIIQELKKLAGEAHAEETRCVNEVDIRFCRGKVSGLSHAIILLEESGE